MSWSSAVAAGPLVINGAAGRYACKNTGATEIHLDQLRRTMFERAAHPDTTVLADFVALLTDRDALLEHRHASGCKYCAKGKTTA